MSSRSIGLNGTAEVSTKSPHYRAIRRHCSSQVSRSASAGDVSCHEIPHQPLTTSLDRHTKLLGPTKSTGNDRRLTRKQSTAYT